MSREFCPARRTGDSQVRLDFVQEHFEVCTEIRHDFVQGYFEACIEFRCNFVQEHFEVCTEFRCNFVQSHFGSCTEIRHDFVQERGKAGKSALLSRKRTNTRCIIEHIFAKWNFNRICMKSCRIFCTMGDRKRRKTHVSFPQSDSVSARNDIGISCTKRGRKLCKEGERKPCTSPRRMRGTGRSSDFMHEAGTGSGARREVGIPTGCTKPSRTWMRPTGGGCTKLGRNFHELSCESDPEKLT